MKKNLESLVIALGSNIDDPLKNLAEAERQLSKKLQLIAKSRIYKSAPVDYLDQDCFFNMVLEYNCPDNFNPAQLLAFCQGIEKNMGRNKIIFKGPRNIDVDIIFFKNVVLNTAELILPHPEWEKRSFVVLPIQELPCSKFINEHFSLSQNFSSWAIPIE